MFARSEALNKNKHRPLIVALTNIHIRVALGLFVLYKLFSMPLWYVYMYVEWFRMLLWILHIHVLLYFLLLIL